MSHHHRPAPNPEASSRGWDRTPVPAALWRGVHLLIAALLVLAILRGSVPQLPGWPGVVLWAGVVAVVYAVGPLKIEAADSP